MNSNQYPDHWKIKPLKEIATVITGKTPPTKNDSCWNGSIPFITPKDLNGSLILATDRTITEEGLKFVKSLPYGTVLVSCIGYVGKVGVVGTSMAVTNQQINSAIPDEDILDSWYLAYALIFLEPYLRDLAGITTVPILNKSNFEMTNIPLPPLPEQRAIARALRAVQGAREARLREVALEKERKAALMEHLFAHGTRGEATKMTEIGEMPESWNLSTIDELKAPFKGSLVAGPFGSNIGKRFFVKSGIPVIRGNNLTKGDKYFIDDGFVFITDEKADELRSCVSLTNDLIFTAAGTLGQIGIIPIECKYGKYIISNKQIRLRVNNLILVPLFLFYWISTSIMQYIIKKENSGTSIPVLNLGVVKRLPVPLPGISEQKEICNYIQIIDSRIAALEHEARLLQELFRAMLEELMSGRLPAGALVGAESSG